MKDIIKLKIKKQTTNTYLLRTLNSSELETYHERASIIEHDGKVSRGEADILALMFVLQSKHCLQRLHCEHRYNSNYCLQCLQRLQKRI